MARETVRPVDLEGLRHRDSGVALLAVIILGTAVALMAHAGLMIGLAMDRAAASGARVVELDSRLIARLHAAVSGLATLDDLLPPGVVGRPLTAELLRVRADSGGRGWAGLVWIPDFQTRLDALVAPVRTGRSIGLASRQRVATAANDSCPSESAVSAELETTAVSDWREEHPLDIGPLGVEEWTSLPSPAAGGTATSTAMFSESSISLGPGHWEGVLLVDGSLEVGAGASVSGWVGVTGSLRIRGGAEVNGVVRVGGSLTIDHGGRLYAMPCAGPMYLSRTDNLSGPRLLDRSFWPTDPFR